MSSLIDIAEKLAVKEIEKYDSPPLELFNISKAKALNLAKRYKADEEVVLLGSILAG